MRDPATMILYMRDIIRPLCKLMTENTFNGTFDIDCQMKSTPI